MIRLQNIDANIKPSRTFGRGKYLIGRSPSCDLEIPDRTMSRQHAMLEVVDDERIYLTDLDSRNGTMVNGERIMNTVRLKPEDIVAFGEVSFSVSPVDDDTFRGDTVPVGKSGAHGATMEVGVDTSEIPIVSKELPLVEALEYLGQVMVDPSNGERVYADLLKGVRLALSSEEASILVWDDAESQVTRGYSLGRDLVMGSSTIRLSEQAIASIVKTASVVRIPESPQANPGDSSSVVLAVRLDFNEKVIGLLCLKRFSSSGTEPNQVFSDINDRTVLSIAHVVGSKLANLQFLQSRERS